MRFEFEQFHMKNLRRWRNKYVNPKTYFLRRTQMATMIHTADNRVTFLNNGFVKYAENALKSSNDPV